VRKTEQVTKQEHVIDFCWAPDSQRFAAVIAPTCDLDDVAQKESLVVLARQDGRIVKTLSTKVGGGLNVAWSPDGKTIAFPELTEKKIARRLALISPSGGKCRYVLDDYLGYPLDPVEWCDDSRHTGGRGKLAAHLLHRPGEKPAFVFLFPQGLIPISIRLFLQPVLRGGVASALAVPLPTHQEIMDLVAGYSVEPASEGAAAGVVIQPPG
jgi:dipeptidyl aminopeptidase/acylaminoacyl peptidase